MYYILTILFAASLCADCFAVTLCSSVSLKNPSLKTVLTIAVIFSAVQAGLLVIGRAFGDILAGHVEKLSHMIGFLLLAYIGGSMIHEALKGKDRSLNLNGLKNIVIGAVATSIDAFAAGISLSMDDPGTSGDILWKGSAVFVFTFLSVMAGIYGGSALGRKFGNMAELCGGIVLTVLGILILFGII